jgi:hypothetical protein
MATTKDNVTYVNLEKVQIWFDKGGQIHITADDSDPEIRAKLNIVLNNNPNSELYHSRGYAQAARILTRYGKTVPGWEDGAAAG